MEVSEAVRMAVVVGALVQTDVSLRLHLLVAIPIGIVSSSETLQTQQFNSELERHLWPGSIWSHYLTFDFFFNALRIELYCPLHEDQIDGQKRYY